VTIRADLQALGARNLIVRTHGGAVPMSRGLRELSLADRSQQQVTEKDRIGAAGAAMVSNGDAIVLDSSSTVLAIARHLKQHRDLTILTNSLAIAHEMLDAPGVTVVMPGGILRREMASLTGGNGLDAFRRFNIQKGFFGATGISVLEGLTDVSVGEAEVKRPLLAMCREVVAVLDAWGWLRSRRWNLLTVSLPMSTPPPTWSSRCVRWGYKSPSFEHLVRRSGRTSGKWRIVHYAFQQRSLKP